MRRKTRISCFYSLGKGAFLIDQISLPLRGQGTVVIVTYQLRPCPPRHTSVFVKQMFIWWLQQIETSNYGRRQITVSPRSAQIYFSIWLNISTGQTILVPIDPFSHCCNITRYINAYIPSLYNVPYVIHSQTGLYRLIVEFLFFLATK